MNTKLVNVEDAPSLCDLIREADVVIRYDPIDLLVTVSSGRSLLPVAFHPRIAELCILERKHLITASYISNSMRSLNAKCVPIVTITYLANTYHKGS